MPEKIGIQSVWDNSQFNKGQAEYIQKITQAEQKTDTMASRSGNAASALTGVASSAGMTGTSMILMGTAFAVATTAVNALVSAVRGTMEAITTLGKEAIMTASRVQQLSYIAQLLGQRMGYSSKDVIGFVSEINRAGIALGAANELVAQFARYNLDMADAVQLAKVAQDAATLANMGSTEALEGLLHGILTYNTRVIRHHGILVNLEDATKQYAATIGKTAEQLTTQEKVQAALNAVLTEGAKIAGAYTISMETAGKQLGTLRTRLIPDLLTQLGMPFQTAFFNAVSAINNLVKGFTTLVSEGGALYPLLIRLGAVASIITEPFKNLSEKFVQFATDASSRLGGVLTDTASRAFSWGANIVSSLASGIIKSAVSVLTAAMNFIGNLLKSWLSPGSPPRVAPDIDKWGKQAFIEYMEGFTEADFDVLENIQNPLREALRTLVDMGELGEEEAGEMFANMSKSLAEAIQAGDISGVMDDITRAGGPFGEELAKLAQSQFNLAMASKEASQAQKDLEAAQKAAGAAGAKVNALTQEYNDLLRKGGSKAALANKLKEINAAKAERAQAEAAAKEAQMRVDASKEQVELLREQVELQKKLFEQLMRVAQARVREPGEEVTPPGGGGGGEIPGIGDGEIPGFDIDTDSIIDPVKDAVDKMRKAILDGLKDVWQKIREWWAKDIAPLFQPLIEAWEKLKKYLEPAWEWLKNAWAKTLEFIQGEIKYWLDVGQRWWKNHGDSVRQIVHDIWNFIVGVWRWGTGVISYVISTVIEIWRGFWERHGETITEMWQTTWDNIKTILTNVLEIIGNVLDTWAAIFRGDWERVLQEIKDSWVLIWENIQLVFTTVKDNLYTIISILLSEMKLAWNTALTWIHDKAVKIWDAIVVWITQKIGDIKSGIYTKLGEIANNWHIIWTGVRDKAVEIWNAIQFFIDNKFQIIKATVQNVLNDIKAWFNDRWNDIYLIVSTVVENIRLVIEDKINVIKTGIETKLSELWNIWNTKWNEIKSVLVSAYNGMVEEIKSRMQDIYSTVQGKIQGIIDLIRGKISVFKQMGKELIMGMKEGVMNAVDDLIRAITNAISQAISAARNRLNIHSPSGVFLDIGENMMTALKMGVDRNAWMGKTSVEEAIRGIVNPLRLSPSVTNNHYNSVQFGMTNYINQPIDIALLETTVKRIIRNEFRR